MEFISHSDREKAVAAVNGYKWKGNVLKAHFANPAQDPLEKKRKQQENDDPSEPKKVKTVMEVSEPLGEMPYEEQLKLKEDKIASIMSAYNVELKKANSIQNKQQDFPDVEFEQKPIIPSPFTVGYRNKVEFTIGRNADGEIDVGNRMSSYREGNTCVASPEPLKMPTDKMKKIAQLMVEFVKSSEYEPFNVENYEGTYRNITVRETRQGNVMLIIGIHPQKMSKDEKTKFQESFVDFFTKNEQASLNVTSIYYEEIQKRVSGQKMNVMKHIFGDTHIEEELLGLKFKISPCSFFQANSFAAEKLYQLAIDLSLADEKTTIMDVCCGTGTIGLCFAKHCKNVYGMELVEEAIEAAKMNASLNQIENATFKAGNADDLIYSIIKKADIDPEGQVVAIVDPPRAGLMTKSIQQLRNTEKIKRLIYISCSPTQALKNFVDLAKNCSKTMKGAPFVLKSIVPVDLFPHTNHCELVLLFERSTPDAAVKSEQADDESNEIV